MLHERPKRIFLARGLLKNRKLKENAWKTMWTVIGDQRGGCKVGYVKIYRGVGGNTIWNKHSIASNLVIYIENDANLSK
jgi:hypothetical protein